MDKLISEAQYQVNYFGKLPKSQIRDAGLRKWVTLLQLYLREKYGN